VVLNEDLGNRHEGKPPLPYTKFCPPRVNVVIVRVGQRRWNLSTETKRLNLKIAPGILTWWSYSWLFHCLMVIGIG